MEDKPSGQDSRTIDYHAISRSNSPYAFSNIQPERLKILTAECERRDKERERKA